MIREPFDVFLAGMRFLETMRVFPCHLQTEFGQPSVITRGFPGPLSTRVMNVTGAIGGLLGSIAHWGRLHVVRDSELFLRFGESNGGLALEKFRIIQGPMGGVQKLTVFQEHFDDVFVYVPPRATALIPIQGKDVHDGVASVQ